MDSAPERIYFNTDRLPERDRFPAVREEFARQLLTVDCSKRSSKPFSAKFDIHRVGRLAIGYIDTSPAEYVRTPELIRDGQDFLFATLNFSGTMFCSQPDSSRAVRPGEAVLLDAAHVRGIHFDASASYLTIRVPRADVTRLLPADIEFAGARLDRDPLARQLLFSYLGSTRTLDLSGGSRAVRLYDEHIFDLIVLALGAEGEARAVAEDRGLRAARRAAVLQEVASRSDEADLSAATVALRLGITPRYVHHLLEATGKSFTHHLLERRLERAAVLLRDPRWRYRRIAEIAAETGFTDLSYFNRAFRRRFAATPSDLRASAALAIKNPD